MLQPKHNTTALRAAIAALTVAACIAGPAFAAVDEIDSCDATCSSNNCKLKHDLQCCGSSNTNLCDGTGPITLSNGKDLDMNGFSIRCMCGVKVCDGGVNDLEECTSSDPDCPENFPGTGFEPCSDLSDCGAPACNYHAITMTGTSSKVHNSDDDPSTIHGRFTSAAINCGDYASSQVVGIQLRELDQSGVQNCAKVLNNVFVDGAGSAIITNGVASTDEILDNYISDWGTGIRVTSGFDFLVQHNLIFLKDGEGQSGINTTGNVNGIEVTNNVIAGQSTVDPIQGSALGFGGIYAENYCDPDWDDCQDCIDAGFCSNPLIPFSFD